MASYTTLVARNITLQVALTYSSAISPTAVTKANPGVGTLTAHGMTDNTVGYWTASSGMVQLDGQAAHIIATSSSTFTMNGLDTSGYDTFASGPTFTAGATYGTISETAGVTVGGGAADSLDDTRLIHVKKVNVAGLLAPQDLTISIHNPVTMGTALAFVMAAAKQGTSCLFKLLQGSNYIGVYYGVPSVAGIQIQAGALATGDFNVQGTGWFVQPNL